MDHVWYYADQGQSIGPTSLAELIRILSRMVNARSVLVWRDGFANWEMASDVPELAAHVVKPPPLPVPPPPLPRRAGQAIPPQMIAINEDRLSEPISKAEGELVGIGGWLIVIALGRIFGPFALMASAAQYYNTLDNSIWTSYPFVAYSEAALNGAAVTLSIWTTVLFFRKSKSFPVFFVWNSIASVLLLPIDLAIATGTGQSMQAMISLVEPKEAAQWGQAVMGALIWIPYIKMSKRVANTFVH